MKKLIKATLLIALFSQQLQLAYSQRSQGIISKITDGDSFDIISNGQKFEVRLNGIDCPESDQPYGLEATSFVKQYLYQQIEYVTFGLDKYNRVLADVYADGILLNSLLIDKGLAWHYKAYSTDQALSNKEEHARAAKIGIWGQNNPIAPWDWRKQSRTYNNVIYSSPSQTTPATYNYSNTTAPQYNSNETVIICGGQYATKYHRSSNCRGLSNCRGGISQTTKNQAQGMGRTPCAICY